MLKIDALFDDKFLEDAINDKLKENYDIIAKRMQDEGVRLIDLAIAGLLPQDIAKIFGNITHNLRSSMGVGIVIDGKLHSNHFPYGVNDEGEQKGRVLINTLASQVKQSEKVVLIMVAGMRYAGFVEAKGFDVITMSTEIFKEQVKFK